MKLKEEVILNKYIVEFIGTLFLVLTIGLTVIEPGAGAMAPLAIGSVLMVMIFAGGHISGAHYNPAVTLSVWMRGRCPSSDVPGYVVAQLAGASIAAFIVMFLKGNPDLQPLSINPVHAIIAEFLFTFVLCYVVLNVATSKNTSGNSFYGLAIGFTVMTGAYAVGSISGGVFNPAVAAGITIMGISGIANIWVYLVSNLAGGAVAAVVFNFLNPEDK